MRVFVVGSKGYIGRSAVASLQLSGLSVKPVSSHPDAGMLLLDLLKPEDFHYSQIDSGDLVLFTAAISSPDVCRNNHKFANAVNVRGTGQFIDCCLKEGARVVFFSSDTVYGPGAEESEEGNVCNPAGDYAIMKCEIESRFKDHPAFKVLRLSYVFSREDKFTSYLTACASENKTAEIFHPMFRRAVYLADLLDLLTILCSSWDNVPDSVINVCGPELLSRFDMARLFCKVVSPELCLEIIEPSPDFFTARPQVINMCDHTFSQVLGRQPIKLYDAMISEFKSQGSLQ